MSNYCNILVAIDFSDDNRQVLERAIQRGDIQRHSEDVCHPDSESVICYGTARVIDDLAERTGVLNEFNHSFRPDADPISTDSVAGCGAVEIVVDEMTGRRELGREVTCWRYRFR